MATACGAKFMPPNAPVVTATPVVGTPEKFAFEPSKGKIPWHSTRTAAPGAGPITVTVDGRVCLSGQSGSGAGNRTRFACRQQLSPT